ncbi:lactococcin 972 family bacteriocin [Diaminobutyricibacter tongyongensis]|uniref:Lactococcin 972 family bacteriocin n=1 Tax=Leifsonia tongyongensis TaxID=1268043 RepID=A0A6L9XVP7_9MICO|nr:lactococcin 972 family bacteriocin [Diaminobutyricibacter tongyongensis]NEN05376.1 lactococcin 972 family bacteriocin [Diaminobutyricibacter tongyongensis]
MKSLTKVLALAAATAALLTVGVTGAQAAITTAYPEGGTWKYGVSGKYTTSDYLHNSRVHRSTAVGVNTVSSYWIKPGSWSYTQAISALGGNKAYYDVQ